jgi:hypothetical protein
VRHSPVRISGSRPGRRNRANRTEVCKYRLVLSACTTIAGDKPGAEALSVLARAFFYAGARALLVSYWSVDSEAATRLTTSTFAIMKAVRSSAPRGGAVQRDAGLHERQVQPAECLPGILVGIEVRRAHP